MNVSIIGTGNMGQAIATVLAKGGTTPTMVRRGDPLVDADVVVLAIPYSSVADVVATYGSALAGTIVVDLTNPVDFATFDGLAVPADSSAAAEIAAAVPGARVVKAFNTTFAGALAGGNVLGQPTTVLLAGDDAGAKQLLADLVTAGGLRAVDAGSLKRARELEALGFLQITLAAGEKTSWATGFALA
jgi:hypothetical protein